MLLSAHQRRLLGEFIRARREHLPTEEAGRARRRTPGLRREEIALACGMSVTWYTWMEQGRDISVSAAALARLSTALRLSGAERAYLFELARQRDPAATQRAKGSEDAPVTILQAALDAIAGPAYLLDPSWCAAAWNVPAQGLFADWLGMETRSLLDYMFLDARARRLVPDWEDRARRLVAEFRADTGRRSEDADLLSLVERLCAESETFAAFWLDQSVMGREGGLRLFDHPIDGPSRYRQITLHPAAWPDYKLVMLVVQSGS